MADLYECQNLLNKLSKFTNCLNLYTVEELLRNQKQTSKKLKKLHRIVQTALSSHTEMSLELTKKHRELQQQWDTIIQQLKMKIASSLHSRYFTLVSYIFRKMKVNANLNNPSLRAYKENIQSNKVHFLTNSHAVSIIKRQHEFYNQYKKLSKIQQQGPSHPTNNFLKQLRQNIEPLETIPEIVDCWKCLTYFYQGALLIQSIEQTSKKEYRNYWISQSVIQAHQKCGERDEIQSKICMALNQGCGYIYLGIREMKGETIKIENEDLKNVATKQQVLSITKLYVQGIKLKDSQQKHQEKLRKDVQECLREFIHGPKQQKSQFQINYLPVLVKYSSQANKKQDGPGKAGLMVKNTYVIRIKFETFAKKKIFCVKTQKLEQGKVDFTFFNNNEMIKGYGVYEYILKKYRQYLKPKHQKITTQQKCFQCRHFKKRLQQFQQAQQQQTIQQRKEKKADDPYRSIWFNKQRQQPKAQQKKQKQRIIPDTETDPNLFGRVPIINKFKNCTVLILTSNNQITDKQTLNQIKEFSKKNKLHIQFNQESYEKLPRTSDRKVYVLNHEMEFNNLTNTQIFKGSDKKKLLYLNVRPILQIIGKDRYLKALKLFPKFKQMFNINVEKGQKTQYRKEKQMMDTCYYLLFKTKSQVLFMFHLLEYNCIRVDFVGTKQLDGLELTCQ